MSEEFAYSQEKLDEELRKYQETFKKPNILICGQTGAGKSSIVNFIFKDEVAKVSDGEPCTRDITLYKNDLVNIYDSEGYELGREDYYKKMLFDEFLCKDEHKGIDGEESVHLVWYVVNGASKRFTPYDAELCHKIRSEKYKLCIIISQIDNLDETQLDEMVQSVKRQTMDVVGIKCFRTSNKEEAINARDEKGDKYTDWDELIEWSMDQMPEMCKDRFASAMKKGLKEKESQAKKRIIAATAAAATVGASPIPYSDAVILIPIQTGLVLAVLNVYGLKFAGGAAAVAGLLTAIGVKNAGKAIAGNLIKMIPGVGSFVGGVINAAVAAAFTAAIGEATSVFAYKQCEKAINGESDYYVDINDFFNSDFMNLVNQILSSKLNK
ncbi:GTPase [uncultured Fibrobacter sp.]|uniref:GTPase n=1 Tax=uncultured Fibrobacter sp. TaxID=261512 RepID=UPI0026232428|nr:GTPase [uncultured Fibrobacter sp.]MBR6125234.1 50S ribosome-binding GTPase [Candidatus Saccharibacteria bacterium]